MFRRKRPRATSCLKTRPKPSTLSGRRQDGIGDLIFSAQACSIPLISCYKLCDVLRLCGVLCFFFFACFISIFDVFLFFILSFFQKNRSFESPPDGLGSQHGVARVAR